MFHCYFVRTNIKDPIDHLMPVGAFLLFPTKKQSIQRKVFKFLLRRRTFTNSQSPGFPAPLFIDFLQRYPDYRRNERHYGPNICLFRKL